MDTVKSVTSYPRMSGIVLVLTAAVLWGVSGTVAQYLFQQHGFSPEWLVVIRLLFSGLLLLGIAYRKERQRIWQIWKVKHNWTHLLLFSFLGMLAVQYTFFNAIHYGNAATATILQYLAPVLITCFIAVRAKRLPTAKEVLAVGLALVGTFLLVTQGSFHSLSISGGALVWGLSSAVALAFYTIHPRSLLAEWGSTIVVGWGMFIGGVGFSLIHPPWEFAGQWSVSSFSAVVFVVIFGTLVAFYCYMESLRYLSASETSLLACVEPLSAAILTVIWLQVPFGLAEWLGTACILSTIIILTVVKEKDQSADG
ncbi:DMT family transporter [Brevibacillus fulvus]|uniref:Drug/metabolite transporter (DMT)-like permease n=1 Tax=Brevibacillus fulvus TaxID=1125967 RepID=A0A939BVD7_9BACL|nr:EamA family transporter [Brevibacillus fulvus]MBM7591364.1 drug/metabolite transporter (DMT)-like permease [Brevibacillus fulvus]